MGGGLVWDAGIAVEIEDAFELLVGCLAPGDLHLLIERRSSLERLKAREASDPTYAARLRKSREANRAARMAADPVYAARRKRQKREASRRSERKRLDRLRAERAARQVAS